MWSTVDKLKENLTEVDSFGNSRLVTMIFFFFQNLLQNLPRFVQLPPSFFFKKWRVKTQRQTHEGKEQQKNFFLIAISTVGCVINELSVVFKNKL